MDAQGTGNEQQEGTDLPEWVGGGFSWERALTLGLRRPWTGKWGGPCGVVTEACALESDPPGSESPLCDLG